MAKAASLAVVGSTRPALETPSDLSAKKTAAVATALNRLLADAFVLYMKTKNFHWHLSGPNFRDFHRMLDEQAADILESIDPIAERVRKIGEPTLKSLGQVLKLASLAENTAGFVNARDMLIELMEDNKKVARAMREAHTACDDNDDVASASLIEIYIDQTEKRTWFLFEASRNR